MITQDTQIEYYRILKQHGFEPGVEYEDGKRLSPSMHESPYFGFYIVFDHQRHLHPYIFDGDVHFNSPEDLDLYLNLTGVFEA